MSCVWVIAPPELTAVAQTCTTPVDSPLRTDTLTVWAALAVVVSMTVE
jgi:hypothetical protein